MIWLLIAQASLGATNYTVDEPMAAPTERPSFADEFDGKAIDTAKWRFDTERNAAGWFNNEKQYYADNRRQNSRLKGGALVIEARRERLDKARAPDWGGQGYTSARMIAREATGYGFYEIRAKLPCARGAWPAIWMLPKDGGKWPEGGEIDIMEMVGWNANVVHATLHSGDYNHRKNTQRGAQVTVPTACSAYHSYQLDWRPDAIVIGVDGRGYMRVANDGSGKGAWPFDRPFELILNLAVGGDWGGAKGVDDTAFPQRMSIDYVRYWRR
jgi:beta-glucanase (GH16 family)